MNSASEAIDSKFPTNVVVSASGVISWVPLGLYTSACGIDITWFPFDDQRCTMKFGSWTYDGNKINLTSMEETIDMSTYQPSGEWDIVGWCNSRPAFDTSMAACPLSVTVGYVHGWFNLSSLIIMHLLFTRLACCDITNECKTDTASKLTLHFSQCAPIVILVHLKFNDSKYTL